MSKYLLIALTFASTTCFGQQWIDHQVDSLLTVSVPDNFEVVTRQPLVIKGQVDYGLIMVSVLENKGELSINLQDEDDLTDGYTGFVKGMINAQRGELIADEIVNIDGLKVLKLSFKTSVDGEAQIRHCQALFLSGKIYAFYFWELESMTTEMTSTRKTFFFESIKLLPSLTMEDQFTHSLESSYTYKAGLIVGYVLGAGLVIAVIALVIFGIVKLVKKVL